MLALGAWGIEGIRSEEPHTPSVSHFFPTLRHRERGWGLPRQGDRPPDEKWAWDQFFRVPEPEAGGTA